MARRRGHRTVCRDERSYCRGDRLTRASLSATTGCSLEYPDASSEAHRVLRRLAHAMSRSLRTRRRPSAPARRPYRVQSLSSSPPRRLGPPLRRPVTPRSWLGRPLSQPPRSWSACAADRSGCTNQSALVPRSSHHLVDRTFLAGERTIPRTESTALAAEVTERGDELTILNAEVIATNSDPTFTHSDPTATNWRTMRPITWRSSPGPHPVWPRSRPTRRRALLGGTGAGFHRPVRRGDRRLAQRRPASCVGVGAA